ncbi:molecular chaperone [Erwiniaceae bacterium CAU 1747]
MRFFLLVFLQGLSFFSYSGVIPENSRIVFDGDNKLQSSVLVNTNKYPVVVQLWVDNGDFTKTPEKASAPFFVTPVTSKMDPLKLNEIKIIFSGELKDIPQDRESLYWLNIFEIPPVNNNKKEDNEVTLSMLTQIKLIYRPARLRVNADELRQELQLVTYKLEKGDSGLNITLDNPTPYVANLASLAIFGRKGNEIASLKSGQSMDLSLLPMSSKKISTSIKSDISNINGVEIFLVNDKGGVYSQKQTLPPNALGSF